MPNKSRPIVDAVTKMHRMRHIKHCVFMKVGSHGSESFDAIVSRKSQEQKDVGFMLWGYSGTLLNAYHVRSYLESATAPREHIPLLLIETQSPFRNTPTKSAFYSLDKRMWYELPKGAFTLGCDKAIVCRNLRKAGITIDLSSFVVAVGPSKGKPLNHYLRHRTDKACAAYGADVPAEARMTVNVDWVADIVPPYAVYLSSAKPLQGELLADFDVGDKHGVFQASV